MLFWLSKTVYKNVWIIVRMPFYCTLIYISHLICTGWLIDWSFFVFNFHNSSWIGGGIVIGLISYVHDLINYSIVCCYIPHLVDSCLSHIFLVRLLLSYTEMEMSVIQHTFLRVKKRKGASISCVLYVQIFLDYWPK